MYTGIHLGHMTAYLAAALFVWVSRSQVQVHMTAMSIFILLSYTWATMKPGNDHHNYNLLM